MAALPLAKKGQLAERWGGDPPEALWRGLAIFESALNRVEAHDIRADREERERERAEYEAKRGVALAVARPRPRRNR